MRLLALAGLAACAPGTAAPPADAPAPALPGFGAFTVRARLASGPLTWSVETAPQDEAMRERLEQAVVAGLAAWAPHVPFAAQRARADQPEDWPADWIFGWRTGAHDACPPFRGGRERAHAGPVARGSFVHFDRGHDWTGAHDPLRAAAVHELGHLFGLGHSGDPEALMFGAYDGAWHLPSAADVSGVQSLYGGGRDAPADLIVTHASGASEASLALVLRGVAPPASTGFGTFDVDGDGDDELLVWRHDRAGYGRLLLYHFAPGPRLARTRGPHAGVTRPGSSLHGVRTTDGERVLLAVDADGRYTATALLARGDLAPWPDGKPLVTRDTWRDADGDGHLEVIPRAPKVVRGDLDGDGRDEIVRRR